MFNLEQALTNWRRQMLAAGIQTPVPLEELESHLRDDLEEKVQSGLSEEAAFTLAVRQMGRAEVLQPEFVRSRDTFRRQLKNLVCMLAGIPNSQLVTSMNTTPSSPQLEPRWASYFKAAIFALPAAFLWLFTVVFILPKLNQLSQQTGGSLFTFKGAPGVFQASAFVGQGLVFLTHYSLFIGLFLALAFYVLEARSAQWPRYRRAVLGTGTFLLNLVVMLSLTLLVISAVVTLSMMNAHHLK